jgi:hypothetical protein
MFDTPASAVILFHPVYCDIYIFLLLLHISKILLRFAGALIRTPTMASNPPSGTSTPRFASQTASAEDLLKSQTVGLVNLADFRKRRADVLELKEKEAREGTRTPDSDG